MSRHRITLWCALALAGACLCGCTMLKPASSYPDLAAQAKAASPGIGVYAGGVAGVGALADPDSSKTFRALGGGLYLHNNGWADLSEAQQKQALTNFSGRPVAIELGFTEGAEAWAERLKSGYLALGIKPCFIAANAFAGDHKPTVEQWAKYSKTLRAAGLPAATLILPTFEYANFGGNIPTLRDNMVSGRKDFQGIIRLAGGIVLDSPPKYAFAREENYRAWLVDAALWARKQKLTVVWITSPHGPNNAFRQETEAFLNFLAQKDALPTVIVSENYNPKPPKGYPNVVGHEDRPNTTLGVGRYLLETLIPGMSTQREQSPAGDISEAAPEK